MIIHLLSELRSWSEQRVSETQNEQDGNFYHIADNSSGDREYVLMPLSAWIDERPQTHEYIEEGSEQLFYNWRFACNDIIELDLPVIRSKLGV